MILYCVEKTNLKYSAVSSYLVIMEKDLLISIVSYLLYSDKMDTISETIRMYRFAYYRYSKDIFRLLLNLVSFSGINLQFVLESSSFMK